MWLATKLGFFSIVQKAPAEFHIRGRLRTDLENLLKLSGKPLEILEWPAADYRFRVIVNQQDFVDIMVALALTLDYPNFKGCIATSRDQRPKLKAYHEIWGLLAELSSGQGEPASGSHGPMGGWSSHDDPDEAAQ